MRIFGIEYSFLDVSGRSLLRHYINRSYCGKPYEMNPGSGRDRFLWVQYSLSFTK